MTLVLRSRADITLDAYYRVAWRGEDLRFDAGALARMAACREAFLGLIESDEGAFIYGVTSGYGQNAHLRQSAPPAGNLRPFAALNSGRPGSYCALTGRRHSRCCADPSPPLGR